MERTASEIGSLKSSPSTSTVKKPVIDPRRKLPARSKIFGSRLNTDGVIAFLAGRFAGCQADLALGHGQARHRIHHQQDVCALVAEIFGDSERHKTGADAQGRRPVGGGDTPPRSASCLPGRARVEKSAHLAVAFADQGDHADVGGIVA